MLYSYHQPKFYRNWKPHPSAKVGTLKNDEKQILNNFPIKIETKCVENSPM